MAKSNGMKDKVTKGRDTSRGTKNSPASMVSIKPMRQTDKVKFVDKGKPKK